MKVVGVWPAEAARARARLLGALGDLAGVRFEPIDSPAETRRGLGALLLLPSPDARPLPESGSVPTIVLDGGPLASLVAPISFADTSDVDGHLRGQTLLGNWSPVPIPADGDHLVLATAGSEPVWRRRPGKVTFDTVSIDLPELGASEQLRHRLRPGHCLGLLALLQFVRDVFGRDWSPPGTRACIVVDDPNIRKPTYGHVDYRELVRHADRFDYHVAFAQIPRDLRSYDRNTAALFRAHPERLSLALHGNDHTRRELMSPRSESEADQVLAQALRRVAEFELRTGVHVSRVMVPPHDRCSELVLAEMARIGFEAVTVAHPPMPPVVTAGLGPAEVGESGMPVIVRRKFGSHDEVILRAFMDQPVVLYGHQGDFAAGLGFLEEAAGLVNRMAGSTWCDLGEMARSNYLSRRSGEQLEIRAFTRRMHVSVEPGVRAVVVEPLIEGDGGNERELSPGIGREFSVPDSARSLIVLDPSETRTALDIRLESDRRIDPNLVASRGLRISPYVRRWATEARDRSHPLRARVRPGKALPAQRDQP